ncbi:neuropeptide CCHamide-1 receptor-like [Daphnia pulex]|uniref:neuropeptide CCHamide-1 receptor-like n=1 Tax=Daphnia pulex TaxID=6669 RepID=UPI001EE0FCC8|nr:neuropeptide CCHamide-1 receptor-like [Daphnia pulex]
MLPDDVTNEIDPIEGETVQERSGYIAYNERLETYIVPVVFGIIFLVGVVGNGSLMFILCRHKSMRSAPNTLIFNLALGDILVLVCSVPFTSTIYTFESWPYGEFVCKASEFAKDTSVGVSVFTLTVLSFDRYTAIERRVPFLRGPKPKLVIAICVSVIWVTSIGLALPAALFSHLLKIPLGNVTEESVEQTNGTAIVDHGGEIVVCYPFPQEFGPVYAKTVVLVRFIVHYFQPLLIISTFYAIMTHHLLRSVRTIPGQAVLSTVNHHRHPPSNSLSNNNQNRSRRKVAKMVQCLVVLFAVCFLPMHIFFLWFHFDSNSQDNYNDFWNGFRIFGFVLAYINSCINPIALYCVSTKFRKHFNRLLPCRCSGGDSRVDSRRRIHGNEGYPLHEFHAIPFL